MEGRFLGVGLVGLICCILVIVSVSTNHFVKRDVWLHSSSGSDSAHSYLYYGLKKYDYSTPTSSSTNVDYDCSSGSTNNPTNSQGDCDQLVKASTQALSLGIIAIAALAGAFVLVVLFKVMDIFSGRARRQLVGLSMIGSSLILAAGIITYSQVMPVMPQNGSYDFTTASILGTINSKVTLDYSAALYATACALSFFGGLAIAIPYGW